MTQVSNKAQVNHAPYTSVPPSDFDQTLRNTLTKALETYHAPLHQNPELSELLWRLARQDDKK
jgi:hypothetical protein